MIFSTQGGRKLRQHLTAMKWWPEKNEDEEEHCKKLFNDMDNVLLLFPFLDTVVNIQAIAKDLPSGDCMREWLQALFSFCYSAQWKYRKQQEVKREKVLRKLREGLGKFKDTGVKDLVRDCEKNLDSWWKKDPDHNCQNTSWFKTLN